MRQIACILLAMAWIFTNNTIMADNTPQSLLHDSEFELDARDIEQANACVADAPWGETSWGIEASLFGTSTQTNALDWYRFLTDGTSGYMYGRERAGEWGFVRYVQGSAWNGSNCDGSLPWYQFEPVLTSTHEMHITLDISLDTTRLLTSDDSWLMFAANLWFRSPDIVPQALGAANLNYGNKPLVIDLVLYHDCNIPDCRLRHFEDDVAFHYMYDVQPIFTVHENTLDLPLAPIISHALTVSYLDECTELDCMRQIPENAAESLELHQAEAVIELHHAEGAARINSFDVLTIENNGD